MPETISTTAECPVRRAVVQVLAYFEIFSYPLTAAEIFQFSSDPGAAAADVQDCLNDLVEKGIIFRFGDFFQSRNDPSWVAHRLEYNRRADRLLPVARRMARFIGSFPFVRAVFVSGSMSKHCMRPDSDIDFFVVTEPRRLWLARTLLVCFKKLFLFNSHKYFCVNYFVDTAHLEIEEKNIFTATETATLLPMYGREWYEAFCRANTWSRDFLPHFQRRPNEYTPIHRTRGVKKTMEWLLAGRAGDWFDRKTMQWTVAHWRRKFRHFDDRTFDGAFKSRRHVSKHHPLYFQQRVLQQLEQKKPMSELGIG